MQAASWRIGSLLGPDSPAAAVTAAARPASHPAIAVTVGARSARRLPAAAGPAPVVAVSRAVFPACCSSMPAGWSQPGSRDTVPELSFAMAFAIFTASIASSRSMPLIGLV